MTFLNFVLNLKIQTKLATAFVLPANIFNPLMSNVKTSMCGNLREKEVKVNKRAVCVRCQASTAAAETHVPHPCCLLGCSRGGGCFSFGRTSHDSLTLAPRYTRRRNSIQKCTHETREPKRQPDCSNQARLENIMVVRSPENHKQKYSTHVHYRWTNIHMRLSSKSFV